MTPWPDDPSLAQSLPTPATAREASQVADSQANPAAFADLSPPAGQADKLKSSDGSDADQDLEAASETGPAHAPTPQRSSRAAEDTAASPEPGAEVGLAAGAAFFSPRVSAPPTPSARDVSTMPVVWTSEQLFGNHLEVFIQHNAQCYRLRRTRNGKLILCK